MQGHKSDIRRPRETLRLLSRCVRRTHLVSQHQRVTARGKCCLLRKRVGDSVPWGFTKDWSGIPDLQRGSRCAPLNHTLRFRHSLFSLLEMRGGSLPKSRYPGASQGPTQQAGLSTNSCLEPAVSARSASRAGQCLPFPTRGAPPLRRAALG